MSLHLHLLPHVPHFTPFLLRNHVWHRHGGGGRVGTTQFPAPVDVSLVALGKRTTGCPARLEGHPAW